MPEGQAGAERDHDDCRADAAREVGAQPREQVDSGIRP